MTPTDAQIEAVAELRRALEYMIEEKADYMRINKLGDPETQFTIKRARAAILAYEQSRKEP